MTARFERDMLRSMGAMLRAVGELHLEAASLRADLARPGKGGGASRVDGARFPAEKVGSVERRVEYIPPPPAPEPAPAEALPPDSVQPPLDRSPAPPAPEPAPEEPRPPRQSKQRVDDAQIAEMRARFEAGASLRKVGAPYGISANLVSYYAKTRGWQRPAAPAPEAVRIVGVDLSGNAPLAFLTEPAAPAEERLPSLPPLPPLQLSFDAAPAAVRPELSGPVIGEIGGEPVREAASHRPPIGEAAAPPKRGPYRGVTDRVPDPAAFDRFLAAANASRGVV